MPRKQETPLMGSVRPTGQRFKASYVRNGVTHRPGETYTTRALAEQWLRDERKLLDGGIWTPPAKRRAEAEAAEQRDTITLDAYARTWIQHRTTPKGTPLHPRTRQDYRGYLDGILKPLAVRPVASITPELVQDWHNSHADTPPTRHKAYSFMNTVMAAAVKSGHVDVNPCQVDNAGRKPPVTNDPRPVVRALTHEKVQQLAGLVWERDRALILVLAYCGVRSGEACALRRSDVVTGIGADGAPFGWLTVNKGVSTYGKQRHESETKTGRKGNRVVPVPPHIVGDVLDHLDEWAEPGTDGLVFPSTNPAKAFRTTQQINGRTFPKGTRQGYGWLYARACIGLPSLHLHWLRHWCATLWDEAGTPEALRREILGHAQPGMTGHYTHPDPTKGSPYAVRVSELAGWTRPGSEVGSNYPPEPTDPATAALAAILAAMPAEQLAGTLANMPAAQIAALVPHLPTERVAAVMVALTTKVRDE